MRFLKQLFQKSKNLAYTIIYNWMTIQNFVHSKCIAKNEALLAPFPNEYSLHNRQLV